MYPISSPNICKRPGTPMMYGGAFAFAASIAAIAVSKRSSSAITANARAPTDDAQRRR